MRKLILLLSISLLAQTIKAQIVFCPPGVEWHYAYRDFWSPSIKNHKIKYVRDTIIDAETCKILKYETFFVHCDFFASITNYHTLIKQKGDTVFMRNAATQNNWQILYNFAALAGQHWSNALRFSANYTYTAYYKIYVDTVKFVTINGFTLKQMAVTQKYYGIDTNNTFNTATFTYKITERIGNDWYLFGFNSPEGTNCDYDIYSNFLCYQDSAFGVKQFTSFDCNYSNPVDLGELKIKDDRLKIYPNPSSGMLTIQLEDATLSNYNLKLVNVLGQEETTDEVLRQNDIVTLNIQQLKKGIYFLQVFDRGKLIRTEKLIKE